jgi:hypothetical protein
VARTRNPQAFCDGEAFEDARSLEFPAETERGNAKRRHGLYVMPVDTHQPARTLAPVADATHQCGLAGAIRPYQADQFAVDDRKIDAFQHFQAAERL